MMERGVYTHFGTKTNGTFSSHLDEKGPMYVLLLQFKGENGLYRTLFFSALRVHSRFTPFSMLHALMVHRST
jgi:hypothetical protein